MFKTMTDIKVVVTYKGKEYTFDFGSQAYIFHTGVYKGMDERGEDVFSEYVSVVHECYLKDSNRTNLGELADYVADYWDVIYKKLHGEEEFGYYDILDNFYGVIDSINEEAE